MTFPNSSIPRLGHQPLTVDFIDNRLPKYHPAFVNPPVRYDSMSGKYVPISQTVAQSPNNGALAPLPYGNVPTTRPIWTDIKAMQFWNSIFPDSMASFRARKEPKGRSETVYDIRKKDDWDAIYDTLDAARGSYEKAGGSVGWLRKVRRKAADKITPVAEAARIASRIAPNDPYATPVLGAVEVLLDAVRTAARVRKEVLQGFDGLTSIFSDVELFLGTFPKDENILSASMDLTVATLDAVEQAIGFFIRNEFWQGGKAILMGGDYEAGLLQSLSTIKEKSRSLMEEATKSHIHESHMYSQETQRIQRQIWEEQRENNQRLTDGINSINYLLTDHLLQKEADLRRREAEVEASRQELMYLKVRNVELEQFRLTPPPPPLVIEWYINQEALRRILDIPDLDLTDAAFVTDKKAQIPAKQRSQAEQIVNAPLFRNWVVFPRSAKLLVQWDRQLPKTVAGASPLSIFCSTLAHALRAKEQFVSALWFCSLHIDASEPGALIGARPMLASLIDQLLRQHAFDTRPLHNEINLAALQAGSLDEQIKLLGWLVQRLPETTTLVCIIDGVVLFERPEFEDEALRVFSSLLALAADESLPAAVKVLFTSTPGTDTVRAAFEEENLILNVDGLPRLGWVPNDERLARELEGY